MLGLAVVALFFAGGISQAQDTYTIKLKQAAKGDNFNVKASESNKQVTDVMDGKGQSLKESTESETKKYVYTALITEKAPGQAKADAFRRTYDKAVITKDGQTRTSSLEGKTVVFTKKGDKFEYRFEDGKELTPEQIADLDDDPGKGGSEVSDTDFMPKKAVKLNETWSVDPKVIAQKDPETSMIFDMDKAKITGKLVRVHKKGDTQFGVIELEVNLPVKTGFEKDGFKVQSGKMLMNVTFDVCIDGTSLAGTRKGTIAMDIRSAGQVNGMNYTVNVIRSGTMDEDREKPKKK